jgi:hypothetical protein
MEPKGSLPHSRECTYPELDQSSPNYKIHLNVIYPHLCLGFPNGLFSSGFPTSNLLSVPLLPIHMICPTYLILLNLIIRTIVGKQYKSCSSSLCSFLHSAITSSLFDSNILLSTLWHLHSRWCKVHMSHSRHLVTAAECKIHGIFLGVQLSHVNVKSTSYELLRNC